MNIGRTLKLSKYNAKKVIVDGIEFDSVIESSYYKLLKDSELQGVIKTFEIKKEYVLIPKFEKNGKKYRSITYTPDFIVYHNDGRVEAIETKGFMTQASELRIKLFNYTYQDINLRVVSYCKKYGGWIEYDDLKKKRKENKKEK